MFCYCRRYVRVYMPPIFTPNIGVFRLPQSSDTISMIPACLLRPVTLLSHAFTSPNPVFHLFHPSIYAISLIFLHLIITLILDYYKGVGVVDGWNLP